MKRFKIGVFLISVLMMLSTCAAPAYALSDEDAETSAKPLTPKGNMTLVDAVEGEEAADKQFIVVQSQGGYYFYIIIDHAAEGKNTVHFLNQVDEADLLSIIDEEEKAPAVCSCTAKCAAGAVNTTCEICSVHLSECAGKEPEPVKPETPSVEPDTPIEPEKKSGNPLLLIVLLAILGVGGAVVYLKFFKKKPDTKGSTDLYDYDYGADDEDEENESEDNADSHVFH